MTESNSIDNSISNTVQEKRCNEATLFSILYESIYCT